MLDLLPSLRRTRIADRLAAGSSVTAASLAVEFGVSEDAIRRDLRALATEGRCQRTYGGALPVSPASAPMLARVEAAPERKRALASAAVPLIRPGQMLFLDNGSTNLALASILPDLPDLIVATNSVPIAAELLRRPKLSSILIGGAIDPAVGGCVDARAMSEVGHLSPDLLFLGACAFSRESGLAAFHHGDAAFKREILRRSRAAAVLLTTEKIETHAPFGVAPLDDIDHLVVEHDVPLTARAMLETARATLVIAEPPR